MKTAEDEAFEEIERRQGGFPAKRAMAADKLLEPVECLDCGSNNVGIPATYDSLVDSVKSQPAQEPVDIAKFVEGMEVSIDVSTGDHDSTNRLFGTVTLVQQNQGSKHGLILLVQDPAPNFKPAAQPVQEPVAWAVYDKRGGSKSLHWPENHSPDGDATMFDAVPLYTTPPKREWVGLKPEEINAVDKGFTSSSSFYAGALWAQAKLKEKNA